MNNNNIKKIYFVIKSLSLKGGGAERVFVDVLNNIRKKNKNINIITFDKNLKNTFYQLALNFNFKSLYLNNVMKSTSLLFFFKKIFIIRKFLFKNKNNLYFFFIIIIFLLFAIASL